MTNAVLDAAVTLDVDVRFAETDLMGIVHHGVYAVWLEAGRISWMDAAGIPYTEVAQGGNHFAVTGLAISYRTPARFGQTVEITTRLVSLRSRQVSFAYEVRAKDDGSVLATATTEHICVDADAQMARIPTEVEERMRSGAEHIAGRTASGSSA
jgi:acyl-CoA thioester hydrolase